MSNGKQIRLKPGKPNWSTPDASWQIVKSNMKQYPRGQLLTERNVQWLLDNDDIEVTFHG